MLLISVHTLHHTTIAHNMHQLNTESISKFDFWHTRFSTFPQQFENLQTNETEHKKWIWHLCLTSKLLATKTHHFLQNQNDLEPSSKRKSNSENVYVVHKKNWKINYSKWHTQLWNLFDEISALSCFMYIVNCYDGV